MIIDDEFPDLGYAEPETYERAMEKKKFFVPHGDETLGIGRSKFFVAQPTVVHFGGFTTHQTHSQTVSVVNCSSNSQRLSILPPTSNEFKITFSKCGLLAPGMSQQINIHFTPNEYKYHYDAIRIHTEGQDLLIPLHGYPVMNKIEFPTQISFGNTPLCEPAEKVVTLRCSIPVDFSFSIDVIQPHPYFLIRPLQGVVPANGSININLIFHPITLGTCTSVIRLFIAEHNFKPIETVINARAVSGLIEQKALQQAEKRISDLLSNKTMDLSQRFHDTTFSATSLSPPSLHQTTTSTSSDISPRTSKIKSKYDQKQLSVDPVATVLKKTFGEDNIETTLRSALLKPNSDGTLLLGSKTPTQIESGPLKGTKKLIGNLKSTQPVQPRGVGSGNVFDGGAEFIVGQTKMAYEASQKLKQTNGKKANGSERIVEGLRIPQNLNSTAAVNFVLTQEPGKLKPKDLKIAIEKNREERRKQEQEQTRLREEGGSGTGGGGLDLRAILADERLNSEPGDAFKRQLREMAFLTDMEETKKEEVEKTFRVSEEFLGANILSKEDLNLIQSQRQNYRRHRNRTDWRSHLSRMQTVSYISQSEEARAGAPLPPIQFQQDLLSDSSNMILNTTPPAFDSNKNDIWGKRMNTLRHFIAAVGKWIIQRRVDKRIEMLKRKLEQACVTDRQSAKAFVEADSTSPNTNNNQTSNRPKSSTLTSQTVSNPSSVTQNLASLVCSLPNQARERKKHSETLRPTFVPTREMCRRVLFPKYIIDEVSTRKLLPSASIDDPLLFDDRTFFPLKMRAEFMDLGYERETLPLCPVYFRPMSKLHLRQLEGANEENSIRSSAGLHYSSLDIQYLLLASSSASASSEQIFPNSSFITPFNDEEGARRKETPLLVETEFPSFLQPSWLVNEQQQSELNHRQSPVVRDLSLSRPDYRIYHPDVSFNETQPDWILQSSMNKIEYDVNPTLRTRLQSIPGFQSAQTYLLGSYSSRIPDALPSSGPTIIDFFLPDSDHHVSGLCCFSTDHRRSLHENDSDIPSLQNKLTQEDYLTDSESDEEDEYQQTKPSFASVKEILCPPIPIPAVEVAQDNNASKNTKKTAPKPTPPPPQTPVLDAVDSFSVLDEADRKVDQVELMRDRKTLEHATHLRQIREAKINLVTDRLVKISQSSSCQFLSLPVQLPIHHYEEEFLSILETQVEPLSNSLLESSRSVLDFHR